ncbi:MAG TPA: glycosyltransferase, partial [Pseudomonadales bacterium]|nr:glycosyltransferase [Pseudomonadales bacterium]
AEKTGGFTGDMTTTNKHALHIVHGYNEPFLSLSNQYSRALQSDGWRVTTAYLTGVADESIRQKTVADSVLFFATPDSKMKGLKLDLALRVRKLVLQHDIKLIIAQRYKSLYLALLGSIGTNIPVLGIAHAFGVLKSAGRRKLLSFFRARLTIAGVSAAVTADMRSQKNNLRLVALHNCIDTATLESELLSRHDARQHLHLGSNEFVFANVGRLHDDKDQATIIRAFALLAEKYPHTKLLLIGKGKREAQYQALIEQLNLQGRAILTGAVPDAATLFTAFDVYVSASDREPFGIVLTEAMLARIPVISTNCGGAPEVLGEYALYFARGDERALAAHMETMIGLSAQQRAEKGELLYTRLQQQFAFLPFSKRLLTLVHSL